jgi:PAS domain S-box-containing protein
MVLVDYISQEKLLKQYEYLLENIKSGVVFFDCDNKIIYHNSMFSFILGDKSKSYLNLPLHEVIGFKDVVCKKVAEGNSFDFQRTLEIDDSFILVNLLFAPAKRIDTFVSGFMTMNIITSMEKQVDDLLVKELEMNSLIEKSLIGIIVINQNHQLIDANKAFCDLLGYSSEELIGKYSWEYLDGYSEEQIKSEFAKLDEVTNVTKVGFIKKDNSIIKVRVMGRGGKVQGKPVIIYFVDTFPKE